MSQNDKIEKLSEYRHARLRTEMYLGSRDPNNQIILGYRDGLPTTIDYTWVPALFTAYREIFDNAVDEVVSHGFGDRIDVTFDAQTLEISIADNGRGIPISIDAETGKHMATIALCETRAGRNFNDDTRGTTRGLNGVGASIVNMTAEKFKVEIHRDGKKFIQTFSQGDEHVVNDPKIAPSTSGKTGTKITFTPSKEVFRHLILPEDFIKDRVYEAALCYPKLKLYYNGKQVKTKGVEKELFRDHKPVFMAIETEGFNSRFWLVPQFFEDGSEANHSLVNAIPVFNGGAHIDAFRRSFFSGILTALERESKKRRLQPNRSDIADGMLLFNITEMDGAQFDSQSKTRVINDNIGAVIKKEMSDPEFFKKVIRKYPEWIEAIYARCAERTMKNENAELKKLVKTGGKVRVEKLSDATGSDRQKCALFLVEGDSAKGGLVEARNATIHGVLPLKGKVMNIYGMTPKQIYSNDELARIMNTLGLIPGQKAVRENLRYGRVYVTCDADEDGKAIMGLVTNFFYLQWPELFDPADPFVHVFDTPLIIAAKGKSRKYWYADNVDEFDPDEYKSWEITRAKGLAQLKKPDWKYALENPKSIGLKDDDGLPEVLDLLFAKHRADDRKDMIGM